MMTVPVMISMMIVMMLPIRVLLRMIVVVIPPMIVIVLVVTVLPAFSFFRVVKAVIGYASEACSADKCQ
jgi:hypothetical protein